MKHILRKLLFWDFFGKKTLNDPKLDFFMSYGEWRCGMFLFF